MISITNKLQFKVNGDFTKVDDRTMRNAKTFVQLFQHARNLWMCADLNAHAIQLAINMLEKYKLPLNAAELHVNHCQPENLKKHFILYHGNQIEQEAWENTLKEYIEQKKKIIVATSSKKAITPELEAWIKQKTENKYVFYNADKDDKQKNDFHNLNSALKDKQVALWTSQVMVGCSYTLRAPGEVFDHLFGFMTPLSCTPPGTSSILCPKSKLYFTHCTFFHPK